MVVRGEQQIVFLSHLNYDMNYDLCQFKVTTNNVKFLLILAARFDTSGTTPAPAVVKFFVSICQWRVHLFWKQVTETDCRMDRNEV